MPTSRTVLILVLLLSVGVFLVPGVVTAGFKGFSPEGDPDSNPPTANGRTTEVPFVHAGYLGDTELELDGRLDEAAWVEAEAACGFRMWDPDRGTLPSEETVFKVLYDDNAMYFGVACLEKDLARIRAPLSRRDEIQDSDIVSIYVDPYHDRTTGYNFRVNPKGVQQDSYMFNDGDRDDDWNAVWSAETYEDEHGWYAEVRIPFSTVRFRPSDDMTWGLQVYRYMHGRGEDTSWVTWDRETRGFVSRFGELRGLNNVPAPRQLELLPYFVQRATDESVQGPEQVQSLQNFGLDLKYGVTADMTLNATVQPDFGQVEADPATLNLSPFETFFEEKRPFFVEGSKFFSHPDFNMFYSRRIGTGDEYSRIRFAGKLTGKTRSGVSIAGLVATTDVTQPKQGHNLFKTGDRLSNYAVGRVGKEFADGNHRFNVMGTAALQSASRDVYGDRASRDAVTGGVDMDLNFKDRTYNIQASYVRSLVMSEASLIDSIPSSNTQGSGGEINFRRLAGTWQGGIGGRFESDQLDLNDVGFLSAPDEISTWGWAGYLYNPDGESSLFNRGNVYFNVWKDWLYGGRTGRDINTNDVVWSYDAGHRQRSGTNFNGWMQFRNYYEFWWGVEYLPEGTQRYETRGGPLMSEPTTYGAWWGGITDTRNKFMVETDGNHYRDVVDNHSTNVYGGIRWNMSNSMSHRIGVTFRNRIDDTQYLETVNLNDRPGGLGIGGLSYVFGRIHQQTVDITLRTNLLFTRDLSLELYAQPFITTGDYTAARELRTPDSYDLVAYNEPGYDVRDSDFTFSAFNLNAVMRWEYRPGSTVYLLWTQSRQEFDERGDFAGQGPYDNSVRGGSLFKNEPENVFAIKVTYWLAP